MARPSTAMDETPDRPTPAAAGRERVVVAGLGRIGLEYACAFAMHPSAELAGFVEPRADLRRFARGVGFGVASEPTLSRWLDKRACDSIIVCAPPDESAQLVERAVDAGLGVLVHGLAAMPAGIAARIQAALAPSDRLSAAASGVLFQPLFARARRSGALSAERVTHVRASASVSRVFSPAAHPTRDVLEFLVADLMLLLDASFGPVASVRATGQRLYGEWLDEVQVEAKFASGLEAKLEASWSVPDYPGVSMVIEGMGGEGRVIVSDDALEMEMGTLQGRVVAASEPMAARYDSGESSLVVEGWLRLLAGDPAAGDALSVARAVRVAHVLDAVRHSIGTDGLDRAVTP